MKGFKTILIATLLFLVGLGDVLQAYDLSSILALVGVPSAKIGGVVASLSLLFGLLRFVTTTAVGQKTV